MYIKLIYINNKLDKNNNYLSNNYSKHNNENYKKKL